ncbi:hypothetical protein BDW66DRAFT_134224 [Aspergillus desertorum]
MLRRPPYPRKSPLMKSVYFLVEVSTESHLREAFPVMHPMPSFTTMRAPSSPNYRVYLFW